jgi:tetratricopeptide (TPR) repeat protein
MNLHRLLIVLFFGILFFEACTGKKNIADQNDYKAFLKPGIIQKEVNSLAMQLSFWNSRLQKDTGNYVDMMELASCHLQLFKLTGKVDHLHTGDSLLKRSTAKLNNTDPDILFAISQTSITQHRFRDAERFIEIADDAGGDKYVNHLLGFDSKMELGEMMMASKKIEALKDKSSFDYLIRKSKLEDHKGNLDGAIELMEQAFEKVKDKRKSLYCWALSNLGDMYGHAGRVKESYDAYIKVLQKDSSYIYALKGIAWIAYSHDQNTKEAKLILQYILDQVNMPDLLLQIAEIEEKEGNDAKKKEYINRFMAEVQQPGYGNMYNKYLIELYTEEFKDYDKALQLSEKEITNRATPETYDWMAWVYYNSGEIEKANKIVTNYVYKRNFEPDALYHTALIFSDAGKKDKAKELLEECLDSSFEMGPLKAEMIREQLSIL